MDFTASVEDNGACRMHPLDVPSVQAAKPKSAKTRMRLTPTVPKGMFGHSHDDGWVVTHPPSCPEPDSNRQHAD